MIAVLNRFQFNSHFLWTHSTIFDTTFNTFFADSSIKLTAEQQVLPINWRESASLWGIFLRCSPFWISHTKLCAEHLFAHFTHGFLGLPDLRRLGKVPTMWLVSLAIIKWGDVRVKHSRETSATWFVGSVESSGVFRMEREKTSLAGCELIWGAQKIYCMMRFGKCVLNCVFKFTPSPGKRTPLING